MELDVHTTNSLMIGERVNPSEQIWHHLYWLSLLILDSEMVEEEILPSVCGYLYEYDSVSSHEDGFLELEAALFALVAYLVIELIVSAGKPDLRATPK